ncbi:MAG: gliding motility-associated C-terminal domain-containing protein, partial [Cytophagales bacterium]|nr:gliding motility-associated C-terminal domain-containing protein [Cytophagales bacterium]
AFAYGASSYCVNGTDPTPASVSLPGGSFSSASGLTVNTSTGEIDLSSSSAGSYAVSYTTTGACPAASMETVVIVSADDPSFSYSSTSFCQSAINPVPNIAGLEGGSFSSVSGMAVNASTGEINLSGSTPGTYYVRYMTSGACPSEDSVSVGVLLADDAGFSYSQMSYCLNSTNPAPIITGLSGGTFSSISGIVLNSTTGEIDLAGSGTGTYPVVYTTSGPCPSSNTANVSLVVADDPGFSYSQSGFCVNGTDPLPTVTGLAGGTFNSSSGLQLNSSTGGIDLSASTAGSYIVTYQTAGACPNTATFSIVVNLLDNAAFAYSSPSYCLDAGSPAPLISGLPGGSFSSTSGLSIQASTGIMDLSTSSQGSYTVTYTTSGICPNSSTQTVNLLPVDNSSFNYSQNSYCINGSNPTPVLLGLPGGSYSSSSGIALNSTTGEISLISSASGTYGVSYTSAGACPSTSVYMLTILAEDDPGFSYASSAFCLNGSNPNPVISGLSGGVFSSATSISVDPVSGQIDLSGSTAGSYSVTYTTAGACPRSHSETVILNPSDNSSFSYPSSSYCTNGSSPSPNVTGVAGGMFSAASGLALNTTTGQVDVSASTPGGYTVTYTTAGVCPSSSTFGFTLNIADDASFSYSSGSFCQNITNPSPVITGLAGGVFTSSSGLALNASSGLVDLSSSVSGTYTVDYTTAGICPSTHSEAFVLMPVDNSGFSFSQSSYCINGSDPLPTVTGLAGGAFSGSSGLSIHSGTGQVDVSGSSVGTHTVAYTTAGACPDSRIETFVVLAADDAGFSYPQTSYCLDASGLNPSPVVAGLSGGSFSAAPGLSVNASTGAISLSASTAGTHQVTYATSGACPNTGNFAVTILPMDDASFTYPQAVYCLNGSNPIPVVTGLSGGVFSSAQGLTLNAFTGEVPLLVNSSGTYTVNYLTSGPCPVQSGYNLILAASDDARFRYSSLSYCSNETDPVPQVLGDSGGTFSASAGLSIDANTGRVDLSASPEGSYTVRYATANSCPETHEETFVIGDLIPPVASARNVILGLNGQGQAVLSVADVDNQSLDNCGIARLTLNQTEFDCSHVGQNTVSLTAHDNYGNSHSVQAQVIVRDDDPPEISSSPVSVYLNGNGVALLDTGVLSVSDNCGTPSVTVNGTTLYSCAETGQTQFSVVAEDRYGNTASELLSLSVLDTMAPGIICPPDIRQVVLASQTPKQLALPQAVVTDNCPAGVWLTNSFNQTSDASGDYPLGLTTVRWTAGDASGNRSFCDMRVELLARDQGTVLHITGLMQMEEHQTAFYQSRLGEQLTGDFRYQLAPESQALGAVVNAEGRLEWPLNEAHGGDIYTIEILAYSEVEQQTIGRETVVVRVQEVNEPHVIAPVSEQVVGENEELSLQINVSDTDVPENIFIYRLDPAYEHLGIFVHSATGEVLWIPGEEHGGNTYSVRIWVTDNSAEVIRRSVDVPIRVEERISEVEVRASGGSEITLPVGSSTGQLEFDLLDPERRGIVPGITLRTSPSGVIDEQNFSLDQSVSPYRLSYRILDQEYVGTVEIRLLVDDRLSVGNRVHELRYVVFFERDNLPLNIPNMITPNGDGINDTWNILNLSLYGENTVQVFDQYGNRVFYRENYSRQSEWDGTNEGRELPSASYYYIIEVDRQVIRGVLKIVR